MKILLIKTTSLGDLIHCFPALTDALSAHPDLSVDWVVERSFHEVVSWHPAVRQAIPVSIRTWRKSLYSPDTQHEIWQAIKSIRAQQYDYVIDAQGLIKSAIIARLGRGKRVGFASPRETLAKFGYDITLPVDNKAHAVTRLRELFAQALGYSFPSEINYGLTQIPQASAHPPGSVLLLHGTTWPTKHWPESYWRQLAVLLCEQGVPVICLWGNPAEKARAEKICEGLPMAQVMPKLSLNEIASLMQRVKAVVSVDTGLGHLAEALNIPTLSIYGPTDPARTGTVGGHELHVFSKLPCQPCFQSSCSISSMKNETDPPCMGEITPQIVHAKLERYIKGSE